MDPAEFVERFFVAEQSISPRAVHHPHPVDLPRRVATVTPLDALLERIMRLGFTRE